MDFTDMIVGYDLVAEEDYNPGLQSYLRLLYTGRVNAAKKGKKLDFFFHAGESNSSENKEIYDAIALGTKRISHGMRVVYCPELMNIMIDKDICIEVDAVNNFAIGYCMDLRNHPARSLLHAGMPITLTSESPCYLNYHGLTL